MDFLRIKMIRMEMGLTQFTFAELLGISRGRLQLLEHGAVAPTVSERQTIEAVAQGLNEVLALRAVVQGGGK